MSRDYENILEGWLDEFPTKLSLDLRCGPLVTSARKVTRDAIWRMISLLHALISKGCDEGVIHSHRFQEAVTAIIARRPYIQGSLGKHAAGDVTNHVQFLLEAVRNYKRENIALDTDSGMGRSFPKTGALRKMMTTPDSILMNQLVEQVSLPPLEGVKLEDADGEERGRPSSRASSARDKSTVHTPRAKRGRPSSRASSARASSATSLTPPKEKQCKVEAPAKEENEEKSEDQSQDGSGDESSFGVQECTPSRGGGDKKLLTTTPAKVQKEEFVWPDVFSRYQQGSLFKVWIIPNVVAQFQCFVIMWLCGRVRAD